MAERKPWYKRFKLKNLSIAFAVQVFGHQLEIAVIPFRWAKFAFRNQYDTYLSDNPYDFHIYAGPFHIWTMSGLSATLGFDITVAQNSFHNTMLVPKHPRRPRKKDAVRQKDLETPRAGTSAPVVARSDNASLH